MKKGLIKMSKISEHLPKLMLVIYLAVFAFFAYKPVKMSLWITENAIALATVITLIIFYIRKVRFSNLSYFLLLVALVWQTIGGHYCFGDVPFDYVTKLFGFSRNNYDRFGHFMVGFFAFPVMEYFESRGVIRSRGINGLLVVLSIFGVAAIYEVVEWIYFDIMTAANANDVGEGFLGSQGDVWDAQKDILCDGLGAVFTAILYRIRYYGKDVSKILNYK